MCENCKIHKEIPEGACCAWYMDNVVCGDKTSEDCTEYVPYDEEDKKTCEFCEKFDFATATTEISGEFAHINLALCNTRFPREKQFNFCPICGVKRNGG